MTRAQNAIGLGVMVVVMFCRTYLFWSIIFWDFSISAWEIRLAIEPGIVTALYSYYAVEA